MHLHILLNYKFILFKNINVDLILYQSEKTRPLITTRQTYWQITLHITWIIVYFAFYIIATLFILCKNM